MNWIASSDREFAIDMFRVDRGVDAARTVRWFLEARFAMHSATLKDSADAAPRAHEHSAALLRRKRQLHVNPLLNNSDTALRERARLVFEACPQIVRRLPESRKQVAASSWQFDVLLGVHWFN